MDIRYATIKDLSAIAAVEAECFPPAEAAEKRILPKESSITEITFGLCLITEN